MRNTDRHLRRSAIAGVIALVLAAPGCTIARYYNGVPLRGEAATLVEGESSKSDVLRLFGPPAQITHQTDGDAFVYSYDRLNFSSFTLQEPITGQRLFTYRREFNDRDRLIVLFDFGGIVRGVARDQHTQEMPAL